MDYQALMQEALAQAQIAAELGEVPIGCVIVDPRGQVVARAHNRRELDEDPTGHAEIVALREAARLLGHWRLNDYTLVVTLEPCPMCAGALVNARVGTVVYGCGDPKAGAVDTLYNICTDPRLNHRLAVHSGVLEKECAAVLRDFFRLRRAEGRK
jgi:tRNA(adenine34) deaminase